MEEKYIVAADLGSSKIALAIAKINNENSQIIFYREYPSEGISKATVFNPQQTGSIIKKAIDEAQNELNIEIREIILAYSRYNIRTSESSFKIDRVDNEVCINKEEIDLLKSSTIDAFKGIQDNESLYEIICQSYNTEDYFNQKENDIIGMYSDTLEGKYKLFLGRQTAYRNLERAINSCGIALRKTYFAPSIIASACLSHDDLENGIALIDLGAGVTSLSIFKNGILRYYKAIPFGSHNISKDIKIECRISLELADEIKKAFGSSMSNSLGDLTEKVLSFSSPGNTVANQISVKYLSEIIESRSREIISAMLYLIEESGYAEQLGAGIALCGGGAKLLNITRLFEEMSGYIVKRIYPRKGISDSGPVFIDNSSATLALSLIIEAKKQDLSFTSQMTDKPLSSSIEVEKSNEAKQNDTPPTEFFPMTDEEKKLAEQRKKEKTEKAKNTTHKKRDFGFFRKGLDTLAQLVSAENDPEDLNDV